MIHMQAMSRFVQFINNVFLLCSIVGAHLIDDAIAIFWLGTCDVTMDGAYMFNGLNGWPKRCCSVRLACTGPFPVCLIVGTELRHGRDGGRSLTTNYPIDEVFGVYSTNILGRLVDQANASGLYCVYNPSERLIRRFYFENRVRCA